jgi:two-component system, sensor histidine kinase and response regulator
LREHGAQRIPIIALTADAMKGAELQCREAGMDDFLTKPLERARLAESMDRHLSGRSEAQSAPSAAVARAAVPGASAPVDWDEFMALADGDHAFMKELVQLFIDSGDAALRDIRDALERGDLAAVGRAAHSFRGSSANIRAQPASAAAARLEEAARAGAVDRISQLELELRREADRATEFLRAQSRG